MQRRDFCLRGTAVLLLPQFACAAWGSSQAWTGGTSHDAAIQSAMPANPKLPSLFLIGNSGSRSARETTTTHGESIAAYLDPKRLNCVDRTIPETTVRTYIHADDWDATRLILKAGDVVLIQFSYDGASTPGESRPGAGDDLNEIGDPDAPQHEIVHSYGWYLRRLAVDTIARGATPILCSPFPRVRNGLTGSEGDGAASWARDIAVQQKVDFVDAGEIFIQQQRAMGSPAAEHPGSSSTVSSPRSEADLRAACLLAGLKALQPNPLVGYLSAKGEAVRPSTG
jgi:hypothetical protein